MAQQSSDVGQTERTGFLLITNAIRPYHSHNISILSLPPKGRYHFRYPKEFVDGELLSSLPGKSGLLAVRNKENAWLLPLRWCEAVKVQDYGDFIFLDFMFEDVFDYGSECQWEKQNPKIQTLLPSGIVNPPTKDLKPLLLPVPASRLDRLRVNVPHTGAPAASDLHVRRWLKAVALLGTLEIYKNCHFHTVASVYYKTASKDKACSMEELSDSRTGYKFVGNRLYFLELVQAAPPFDTEPVAVERIGLECPAGHIQSLQTSWDFDGRYDRARLSFYVIPQDIRITPSLAVIRSEPQATDSATASIPPTLLDFDIAWGGSRWFWKRILPILVGLLGLVAFFAAERIAGWWWSEHDIPKGVEYTRYAALFLVAWAFNSLSSFVSSLEIKTQGHGSQ